ncbi:hypothetical protein M4I33_06720 [Clostridium sp. LY3-2]|uniref:hypothetical protein n=1 Tax=Clostridium sp. LY3-2 TaxID=2942482 RepID=UPI0021523522|nr:hypothetical protein [Clostridium sp. LY3-2]MCR6514569.1 hypothetical protein [Clostridium sp. LY3-2]
METTLQIKRWPMRLAISGLFLWVIPIVGIVINIIGIVKSIMSYREDKLNIYKVALILNSLEIVLVIVNFIVTIKLVIDSTGNLN